MSLRVSEPGPSDLTSLPSEDDMPVVIKWIDSLKLAKEPSASQVQTFNIDASQFHNTLTHLVLKAKKLSSQEWANYGFIEHILVYHCLMAQPADAADCSYSPSAQPAVIHDHEGKGIPDFGTFVNYYDDESDSILGFFWESKRSEQFDWATSDLELERAFCADVPQLNTYALLSFKRWPDMTKLTVFYSQGARFTVLKYVRPTPGIIDMSSSDIDLFPDLFPRPVAGQGSNLPSSPRSDNDGDDYHITTASEEIVGSPIPAQPLGQIPPFPTNDDGQQPLPAPSFQHGGRAGQAAQPSLPQTPQGVQTNASHPRTPFKRRGQYAAVVDPLFKALLEEYARALRPDVEYFAEPMFQLSGRNMVLSPCLRHALREASKDPRLSLKFRESWLDCDETEDVEPRSDSIEAAVKMIDAARAATLDKFREPIRALRSSSPTGSSTTTPSSGDLYHPSEQIDQSSESQPKTPALAAAIGFHNLPPAPRGVAVEAAIDPESSPSARHGKRKRLNSTRRYQPLRHTDSEEM